MTDILAQRRRRRLARTAVRSIGYCAVLLPLGAVSAVLAVGGGARRSVPWWCRLRAWVLGEPELSPARPPGTGPVLGHALLSAVLGATAFLPLGMLVLFVLRGVLYGFVVPGPYDHSWGGPGRTGAWVAHFLVGLPLAAAAVAVLIGIAAVHQRLTSALVDRRRRPIALLLALLIPLPATALFVAWLHQI
jgi:hypothetical protein